MSLSLKALRSQWLVILACALLALVSGALALQSGNKTQWPDENIYVEIAKGLAQGNGFLNDKGELSAFRPPGYPFAVSLVFRLSESVLLAKFLGVLALSATAWLLALLVKTMAPKAHALAPCLVLAYPVLPYTSSTLTPQILGGLFLVAGLLLVFRFPKQGLAAAAAGILFGALILLIPSFALVMACLGMVLVVGRYWVCTFGLRYILILYLAMAVVVTPWVVRSSLLFGEFVFISTNSGVNLLFGNSPNATSNSGVVDISAFEPAIALEEVALDRHYKAAAIQWIQDYPLQAFHLYLGKVVNYFNYRNDISTSSQSNKATNVLMFISYYPLLLIAVLRCAMWRRYRFSYLELMLYAIYFGNAFLSAIIYTRIRYRLPFDFLLIAMVSTFAGHILQAHQRATSDAAQLARKPTHHQGNE
jgi:hypothetical protein